MTWLHILDRPIAFHPCLVKMIGAVNAALFLSQAIYWSKRTRDPEGWFYKSEKQWESEICLTRREQQGARKLLRKFAFWEEERRGNPSRLFFRVNPELLGDALIAFARGRSAPNVPSNAPTGATPSHPGVRTNAPSGATPRARPIPDTETTTETTNNMAQALRAARVADVRNLMSFLSRKQNGAIRDSGPQARAIGWLLDHGYTVEQCQECLEFLLAQKWRGVAATWTTVAKEIPQWLARQQPAQAEEQDLSYLRGSNEQ